MSWKVMVLLKCSWRLILNNLLLAVDSILHSLPTCDSVRLGAVGLSFVATVQGCCILLFH